MNAIDPNVLKDHFETLTFFFRKETEEYGILLRLICEQQNCLTHHNPISLLQASSKIEEQLPKNQKATKEREEAMQRLGQALQTNLTLETLASFAPEKLQSLLDALIQEILMMTKKIKSKTQLQQRLLSQAQTINESILKNFQPSSASTYDAQGKMIPPSSLKELL